jgi:hypothetical protein
MRKILLVAILRIALGASGSFAHDDETLDRMPALHGGQLRMAGRYHVELVLEPSRIRVYFASHAGDAVAAPSGAASVKLVTGGEERTLALEVLGESELGIDGSFPFTPGMTVEVSVERGEKAPLVVRFAPRGYTSAPGAPPR